MALAGRSVDDWMAYVAGERGWTQTQYLVAVGAMLDRALGSEA